MLNRRSAATIPTTAKMIPRMYSDRNMVVILMLTVLRLLVWQDNAIWPFPDENANLCTITKVYVMYCKITSCYNII